MFPDLAIDSEVPASIRRDVRRILATLTARGGRRFLIQVPAEDYARTLDTVTRSVHYPFRPTLCGWPCAPYGGECVAVVGHTPGADHAVVSDAVGREIGVG